MFETRSVTRLQTTGKKRYELTMNNFMTIGNISYQSSLLYAWDVFLHEITDDSYHLTILTLEHSLLNNNSPALEDIFQATRAMMQMFFEVQIITDKQGRIKQVLNQNDIKARWERSRKQLISFSDGISLRAEQVYNIPETDVTDVQILSKRIQAMEFFDAFFNGFYGRRLPGSFFLFKDNMLRNMKYEIGIEGKIDPHFEQNGFCKYIFKGTNERVGKRELEKAYAAMTFVDMNNLTFKTKYESQIKQNTVTGWLENSDIIIEEFVCPTLQAKTEYHLQIR